MPVNTDPTGAPHASITSASVPTANDFSAVDDVSFYERMMQILVEQPRIISKFTKIRVEKNTVKILGHAYHSQSV